jgi:hypothetical protein
VRATNPTRRQLDAIVRLCRFFEKAPRRSWSPRAHFTGSRIVKVGRTKVHISYGVHVVPSDRGKGYFRSIIGISPTTGRSVSSKNGAWNATLLKLGWYEGCTRELRRRGYRGEWFLTKWGRHGIFERMFTDAAALIAASVDTSKPAIRGRVKTGHFGWRPRPVECLLRSRLLPQVGLTLRAPAPRTALQDVSVMQKPVEEGRHGGSISQELAPVIDGTVGRQQR